MKRSSIPLFAAPIVAALAALSALAGCTWETALPSDAAAIHVERGRELLVTDDAVLASLSGNAADGPLGFRHVLARLPLRENPETAALAWLQGWSQRLRDEGESARADALDAKVLCPWLHRTSENQCSDACERCASKTLRLDDAPFRLVAVANRTDLSVMPDRAADGGEGRLVFALTDGPADAAGAPALPFTVIVEYAQQGTAADWATRWHALGSATQGAFPRELAGLAAAFVEQGTLAQIRTGDAVTGPLVLHEFHLEAGTIVPTGVRNTPRWDAVPEADVRAFVTEHASDVENGTHVLPSSWLASSSALHATAPPYLASVANHDALVRGTCGGCHDTARNGFHIDPLAHGEDKLSRFLVDPAKDLDEMGRRTQFMQVTLAALER
jgi:hypothetical protein